MKPILLFSLVFLLLIQIGLSETSSSSINWLSLEHGNQIFCQQGGDCVLQNLNVSTINTINETVTVINVIGNMTVSDVVDAHRFTVDDNSGGFNFWDITGFDTQGEITANVGGSDYIRMEADGDLVINNGDLNVNDGSVSINEDDKTLCWGAANDACMFYDGTDLVIDYQDVGSGLIRLTDGVRSIRIGSSSGAAQTFLISDPVRARLGLKADTAEINIFEYHSSDTSHIKTLAGAAAAWYMYESSTNGENNPLRIYGYDTAAAGVKYGAINVDNNGDFNIAAESGENLSLQTNGQDSLTVEPDGDVIVNTGDLTITDGDILLANNKQIKAWRVEATPSYRRLLQLDTDDNIQIGDGGTDDIYFNVAGLDKALSIQQSSGYISSGVGGVVSDVIHINRSTDGRVAIKAENANQGSSAYAAISLQSYGGNFQLKAFGDGTPTPNHIRLESTATGANYSIANANGDLLAITDNGDVSVPLGDFYVDDGLISLPKTDQFMTKGIIEIDNNRVFSTTEPNDQNPSRPNLFIGEGSGSTLLNNSAQPYHGTGLIGIGGFTLSKVTTGFYNFGLGSNALQDCTICSSNVAAGHQALTNLISGSGNFAGGRDSLVFLTTGLDNIAIGQNSGRPLIDGVSNIFIGAAAAREVATDIDASIIIGASAGRDEQLSNRFIIDNRDRGSATATTREALLYGAMGANTGLQNLTINGAVIVGNGDLLMIDGDIDMGEDDAAIYFGGAQDASITHDGDDLIINPREVGSGNLKIAPGNIELLNNYFYSVQDTGGTRRNIFGISASNNVILGITGFNHLIGGYESTGSLKDLTLHGNVDTAELLLRRIDNTPTTNDVVGELFFGWGNTSAGVVDYASIQGISTDVTSSAEEGALAFLTTDIGDDGLTERMRIDKNGNVGINVIDPDSQLEVNGNITFTLDSQQMLFGSAKDASITYDGTDMIINPQEVGTGVLTITSEDENAVGIQEDKYILSLFDKDGSAGKAKGLAFQVFNDTYKVAGIEPFVRSGYNSDLDFYTRQDGALELQFRLNKDGLTQLLRNDQYIIVGNQTTASTEPSFVSSRELSDGTGNAHAFVDVNTFSRPDAGAAFNSFDARPIIEGSTNYNHYAGVQMAPQYWSTGTMTHYYPIYNVPEFYNGTVTTNWGYLSRVKLGSDATVSNNYGFYYKKPDNAGTMNYQYGLWIDELDEGTQKNYAIWTNGTTPVYFGGDLNVTGNIESANVFLSEYLFAHTNETIPVLGVSTWTNVTFAQEETQIKQLIIHTHNDISNTTFTVATTGIFEIDYDFDIIDTSASASDIDVAARMIYINGTEIIGSVFETDIIKQGTETELSHNLLIDLIAGDQIILQFIASDADIEISTHGTYGDHPESATITIKKISN